MKALVFGFALFISVRIPAFCQEPANAPQSAQDQTTPPQEAHRASEPLGITPGTPALKDKDFYQKSGYLHPFRRMVGFVAKDQERIWTSPFRTGKKDAKYWLIFGAATGTLIALDEPIQNHAPSPGWLVNLGTNGSYLGAAYTLIPLSAGFYFIGSKTNNQRFREAGLLSFEAMANTEIVSEVLKVVLDRERPLEGNGEGRFFHSPNRTNASFPSGHAINTFALASVFAHEYPHNTWVKIIAYGYAGSVAVARLAANRHFPSDTLAGGAMGWFIGDYVYAKRHNPNIETASISQKLVSHVRFGAQYGVPVYGPNMYGNSRLY